MHQIFFFFLRAAEGQRGEDRTRGKTERKETDLLFHDRPAWMPLEGDSKANGRLGEGEGEVKRERGREGDREEEKEV